VCRPATGMIRNAQRRLRAIAPEDNVTPALMKYVETGTLQHGNDAAPAYVTRQLRHDALRRDLNRLAPDIRWDWVARDLQRLNVGQNRLTDVRHRLVVRVPLRHTSRQRRDRDHVPAVRFLFEYRLGL